MRVVIKINGSPFNNFCPTYFFLLLRRVCACALRNRTNTKVYAYEKVEKHGMSCPYQRRRWHAPIRLLYTPIRARHQNVVRAPKVENVYTYIIPRQRPQTKCDRTKE